MDERARISDIVPASYSFAQFSVDDDKRAFDRLIARREAVADKLRFGGIALNAGSLLALSTLMSSNATSTKWLMISTDHARYAAVAFILGLFCSAISVIVESWDATSAAAESYGRVRAASRLMHICATEDSPEARAAMTIAMEDYGKLLPVEFRYSNMPWIIQGLAHASWLFGTSLIVSAALS